MQTAIAFPTFVSAPAMAGTMPFAAAPGAGEAAGSGAIPGNRLRPGSIDTESAGFKSLLAAQTGGSDDIQSPPVQAAMPAQPVADGIPNLSSAQFAALLGGSPAPAPAAAAPAATIEQAASIPLPANRGLPISTPTASDLDNAKAKAFTGEPAKAAPLQLSAAPTDTDADGLRMIPSNDPDRRADTGRNRIDEKGVLHLYQQPDRDLRRALEGRRQRWTVDETPGSRELFFGPDGEFGGDDFVDLINPLQHIPVVSQLYRWATGDEMYGAAALAGAAPFGAVSALTGVFDLAVRDATGHDLGGNAVAIMQGGGPQTASIVSYGTGDAIADASTGGSGAAVIDTAELPIAGTEQSALQVPFNEHANRSG